MDYRRTVPLLIISVLLGAALGLLYGWVLHPLQPTGCTPDTFRTEYRTEYVLMAAEAFAGSQDPDLALEHLSAIDPSHPYQTIQAALEHARASSFPETDLELLQELKDALASYSPRPGGTEAMP